MLLATELMRSAVRKNSLSILLAAVLFGMTGCGSGSPFDYVDVYGKIVYEDGTPIPFEKGVRIMFQSQAPAIDGICYPRPAVSYPNTNGTFGSVTSYKYGDELVRGKHKVILSATDAAGEVLIPPEYGDVSTTPLEIDTADSPLELKVRKPTEAERKLGKVK